MLRTTKLITATGLTVAAFTPGAASADIIAAVEVAQADGNATDIRLINAANGTSGGTLPASVNTALTEQHPSVSVDGARLAFQRLDPVGGTNRIIVVDLASGQSADLLGGFDAAVIQPSGPTIRQNGTAVATGGVMTSPSCCPAQQIDSGHVFSLSNFPSGPFTRVRTSEHAVAATTPPGRVGHVAINDSTNGGFLDATLPGQPSKILSASSGSTLIQSATQSLRHPVYPFNSGSSAPLLVVARALTSGAETGPGDIRFFQSGTTSTPTALPPIVNAGDESRPAYTPDARYVGFVRTTATDDRLFVWDTQTQTLLNEAGVSLGTTPAATRAEGNLSLRVKPAFKRTNVATTDSGATATFTLNQDAGVGILVQRIVGQTRVLGRKAPKLQRVGRVPFGAFKKGKGRATWDLKVGGRALRPGRYLVTPRALKGKTVTDFGRPRTITVKKQGVAR